MALVTALLSLLVFALILGGCGGQPDPPPAAALPERAHTPPRADNRPVIAAFGDSLTEGFGVDPAQSYPVALQRDLDRLGYRYRVVNLGVSGDTSTDGLSRIQTVLALDPAVVVLEFGANDGLRGVPVAATRANLEQMVAALQRDGRTVILAGMTLPPNYGPEYIRPFERTYHDLAAKYKTPLIPFFLSGVAGTDRYMQRDGLHPNAAGYARVAQTVLSTLEPRLKR
jgi:acyl-CoA thioesterase-1